MPDQGHSQDRSDGEAIRVLLVDDHPVVRHGVAAMLAVRDDLTLVAAAATAAQARDRVTARRPDVALVDIQLPDGDGVELIRELRSRDPRLACLVFTSYADDDAMYRSMLAGAAGYVVKDAPAEHLEDALRRAAAGEHLLERSARAEVRSHRVPAGDSRLAPLTPQEERILGLVMDGATNGEIAARLSLAEKTVRNYVSNMLTKLGMRNRTEMAVYAATAAAHRDESS